MVFAREPFPTEAVQFVALSHRVRRAAHYMAAMGLCMAATVYAGDSWPSAVVILQRVHVLLRLLS